MSRQSLFLLKGRTIPHLLCLHNARAFPLLPEALASVPFGFVLVRVRVPKYVQTNFVVTSAGGRSRISHSAISRNYYVVFIYGHLK